MGDLWSRKAMHIGENCLAVNLPVHEPSGSLKIYFNLYQLIKLLHIAGGIMILNTFFNIHAFDSIFCYPH